jgi:hypothetical protein
MQQSFASLRADGDDGDELCSPPRPPRDLDHFDDGEEEAMRWLEADE